MGGGRGTNGGGYTHGSGGKIRRGHLQNLSVEGILKLICNIMGGDENSSDSE